MIIQSREYDYWCDTEHFGKNIGEYIFGNSSAFITIDYKFYNDFEKNDNINKKIKKLTN